MRLAGSAGRISITLRLRLGRDRGRELTDAIINIRPDMPIGTISPRLYGHFAEHLARCCYDGLWLGTDATVPHEEGFRTDVLDALRAMPVPLLRWPGGCYADHYHWRDGIGPPETRPRRLGMSCGLTVEDDNSARHARISPSLRTARRGAVSRGECRHRDAARTVRLAGVLQQRARHDTYPRAGSERRGRALRRPALGCRERELGLRWQLRGRRTYAREYRRYATMLRHIDPDAELVTCGYEDDWNIELLDTLADRLDLD